MKPGWKQTWQGGDSRLQDPLSQQHPHTTPQYQHLSVTLQEWLQGFPGRWALTVPPRALTHDAQCDLTLPKMIFFGGGEQHPPTLLEAPYQLRLTGPHACACSAAGTGHSWEHSNLFISGTWGWAAPKQSHQCHTGAQGWEWDMEHSGSSAHCHPLGGHSPPTHTHTQPLPASHCGHRNESARRPA